MTSEDNQEQPDFTELTARVYRLCLALTGNEADARDAAQESLLRAWSRRGRRRDGVSWWTWAAGFAIRVCREQRRRWTWATVSRSSTNDARQASEDPLDGDRDRLAPVYDAIVRLPDRQREVLVLRMLLGHSTEESARMLRCPVGTVKSNLHKAVSNLRAMVANPGDEV